MDHMKVSDQLKVVNILLMLFEDLQRQLTVLGNFKHNTSGCKMDLNALGKKKRNFYTK